MSKDKLEKLLWSIALPGFGQLLNQKYIKGITFILLEFLINVQANLNTAIVLSFYGDIQAAVNETNYQWLMFYPCLYLYAIYDAFKDADGDASRLSFLPFVFSAYFMTVGLIYSPFLIGPVFSPILFSIPGILTGFLLKRILNSFL